MRRLIFVALLVLVITACSSGGIDGFVNSSRCQSIVERLDENPLPTKRISLVTGGVATSITVEVANDEGERSRGLMCRSEVPIGTGMLFEFGGTTTGGFWMFNTYVTLDIIYFDRSGKVAGSAAMLPCSIEDGESEGTWRDRCLAESLEYGADSGYAQALELPADWLLALGFVLNDLPADLHLTQ
jgi:uncharacterized membrane protein (UPF0127 family)